MVVKADNRRIKITTEKLKTAKLMILKKLVREVPEGISLEELKHAYVHWILEKNDGLRTVSATELGINYRTILYYLRDPNAPRRPVGRPPKKKR